DAWWARRKAPLPTLRHRLDHPPEPVIGRAFARPLADDDSGTLRGASIILQQPLDVIEFDLRAGRISQTAAQFFEDPADPLHVDLAWDLHRIVVGEFVVAHRPSQRIARVGRALL